MAPATRILFDAGQNVAWKFDVVREQVGNNCQTYIVRGDKDDVDSASGSDSKGLAAPEGVGQCSWAHVAYPGYLNSEDSETLELLRNLYLETDGTWVKTAHITRNDIFIPTCGYCLEPDGSGYDVVADAQFRNQVRSAVFDQLRTLSGALRNFVGLSQKAIEIVFFGSDMTLTFIVTFADGTRVPVVFDQSNEFGFIDKSRVTDQLGNELMTESNSGEFRHFATIYNTQEAAESFLRNAERLGIPIYRGTGGDGRQVSCTWECKEVSGQTVCNLKCSTH